MLFHKMIPLLVAALFAAPLFAQVAPVAPPMATRPVAPKLLTKFETRTFDIAALVRGPLGFPAANDGDRDKTKNAERLMKILAATTLPESWESRGGAGKMAYIPAWDSLCVNQTPAALDAVQKFLDALQEVAVRKVSLELRFVSVPEGFGAKAGWPIDQNAKSLTPEQFQKTCEALKAEKKTDNLSRPYLTLVDGQSGFFQTGQQVPAIKMTAESGQAPVQTVEYISTGIVLHGTPTVSTDGKSVKLMLDAAYTALNNKAIHAKPGIAASAVETIRAESTVDVPHGHAVVLRIGTNEADEVTVTSAPLINSIAHWDLVVKNRTVKKVKTELYVLGTVRIGEMK